jgi:hypothetical protein
METEEQEFARLRTQARAVEQNMERQLQAASQALRGLVRDLPALSQAPVPAGFRQRLQSLTEVLPGVRNILVVDGRAVVVAGTFDPLMGKDLSDRDHVRAVRRSPDPEALFVAAPFPGLRGRMVLTVSRALPAPGGAFAGLLSASLDRDYFQTALSSVLYAPDMRDAITHGDGVLFMSAPAGVVEPGRNMDRPGSFFRRHRESGAVENVFRGDEADGEPAMAALRTVRPAALHMDKPLIVSVSRSRAKVFERWRLEAGIGLLAAIGLALASFAVLLHHHRRERALQEQAEVAELRVHALEGLLPICSFCKSIRDEAGAWHRLEAYASARSWAQFSHGFCPDCAKRHFDV